MDCKKKIALITGSAGGIGKSTAFLFASKGIKVILADIVQSDLIHTCTEILQKGFDADYYAINIAEKNEVEKMFSHIKEKYGRIDILVNNAGITKDSLLMKMTEEQFEKVIDVNLKGAFLCGKEAACIMKEQKEGCIINISSICGLNGNIGQTNYTASKWGIIGMTKTWSKELGKYNIRVNSVAPGFIETNMIKTIPDEVKESFKKNVDLRRAGRPEEVADAIYYLSSSNASFITGAVLEVTGGMTI